MLCVSFLLHQVTLVIQSRRLICSFPRVGLNVPGLTIWIINQFKWIVFNIVMRYDSFATKCRNAKRHNVTALCPGNQVVSIPECMFYATLRS